MNESKETHFSGKVAQKAVILKAGKVLLIRDPRELNEIWELPGGRMNEQETPQAGLARELREELGVDFQIGAVVHLEQFFQHSDQCNALMIAYLVTMNDGSDTFTLAKAEICELGWFTPVEAFASNLFPEYRRTLEVYFNHTD